MGAKFKYEIAVLHIYLISRELILCSPIIFSFMH